MDRYSGVWAAIAALLLSGWGADVVRAETVATLGQGVTVYEHGGGCRKSSPPGQCCHMEKKTGQVHCH
ncbi:hypothetical protein ACSSV8_002179 [Roseovarius sp. MBR-79]|jgi:hypothetical protein